MDQPLDLTISHDQVVKKKKFTIEYLTSNSPPRCSPLTIYKPEPFITHLNSSTPPLHPVENQLNHSNNVSIYSRVNEHVVPNICSPPLTVSVYIK